MNKLAYNSQVTEHPEMLKNESNLEGNVDNVMVDTKIRAKAISEYRQYCA